MSFIKNVINVWNAEPRKFIVDEGVLVFFLIVPFLYPLLYMYLYSNEVVREVPVVVVDDSHSALSREFVRKVDATPDVQIIDHCGDIETAKLQIKNHNAYGVIWIPASFTKDIAEGRQTMVNIYADMSGLLYYKSLLSSCTEVSLSMNKDIKAVRLSGLSDREKEVSAQPIEYDYVPMFNSQNGFATFILPAVLVLVLQQTLVLGITMMAGTEREPCGLGALTVNDEEKHSRDDEHENDAQVDVLLNCSHDCVVFVYSVLVTVMVVRSSLMAQENFLCWVVP